VPPAPPDGSGDLPGGRTTVAARKGRWGRGGGRPGGGNRRGMLWTARWSSGRRWLWPREGGLHRRSRPGVRHRGDPVPARPAGAVGPVLL